jgi:hypothetical protein
MLNLGSYLTYIRLRLGYQTNLAHICDCLPVIVCIKDAIHVTFYRRKDTDHSPGVDKPHSRDVKKDVPFFSSLTILTVTGILRKSVVLIARSLPHKPLRYYAWFGGVSSADRNASNQGVRSNCIFRAFLLAGYCCSTIPQNPTIPCSSWQLCSSPVYRYIIMMLGDAHLM